MNIYLLREDDNGTERLLDGVKTTVFTPTKLGTKEPIAGDADGGFGIRKANGRMLTLTPDANWEERDSVLGSWEKFYPGNPGTIAPRSDSKTYFLKTVEGK